MKIDHVESFKTFRGQVLLISFENSKDMNEVLQNKKNLRDLPEFENVFIKKWISKSKFNSKNKWRDGENQHQHNGYGFYPANKSGYGPSPYPNFKGFKKIKGDLNNYPRYGFHPPPFPPYYPPGFYPWGL